MYAAPPGGGKTYFEINQKASIYPIYVLNSIHCNCKNYLNFFEQDEILVRLDIKTN